MKKLFTLLLVFGLIMWTNAQNLEGKVLQIDEQGDTSAVLMANVQWLHTDVGAKSDANGEFSLPRNATDTLIISFPTYQSDTVVLDNSQQNITIYLSLAHKLSEVRVVARNGSYISVQPILTTVITQEGLRRAACCNLAESFESTVAVDMEYADAMTGARQISMLGLAGIYSQILLENVPYIRLLTHQFGLGFVPGTWMESISVSKGVASVTNGYEAITGQIDIEYKKPETNYERVFFNLYGNSMGKGELNFNSRLRVDKKDRVFTMFLLHGEDQFAKIDMNKDNFLDVPMNKQITGMNRWDYKIPGKFSGRTLADFVWDDRFGGQKTYDAAKDEGSKEIYGLHIRNYKADVITKNGFLLPGNEESIGTILSYTKHCVNSVFGSRYYDADQNTLYANVLYTRKFGEGGHHKLTTGGSLQYDNYRQYLDTARFEGSDYTFKKHEAVPGVFAEYAYILDKKLVVMQGLRFDYDNLYRQLFWTPRLHVKWQATERFSVRASIGKGYRTANVLAENVSLLTSNRIFRQVETQKAEEAYNAGLSIVQTFKMKGGDASIAVDYFYTTFVNQIIIDLDKDVHSVYVYNLNGFSNGTGNHSRSHSCQAELTLKPFERFEVLLAYRYNDVRYETNGKMMEKVLMSPHKGIIGLNYSTLYDRWKFNVTLQINSPMRLPNTQNNPDQYRLPQYSKTYGLLSAQITKKFRRWEIYIGGENLLNYKQPNPILSSDNPFGDYFDATIIYAPITGIMGYAGFRFVLK